MRLQTLESIFNADGKDMIVLPFKSYLLIYGSTSRG